MRAFGLRVRLAWLALRGDLGAVEELACEAKRLGVMSAKSDAKRRRVLPNLALESSTRRWLERFDVEGSDPARDLERGRELLSDWKASGGRGASQETKQEWASRLRKRCHAYFEKSGSSQALGELAELCIEFHEAWRTPWSASEASAAWILYFQKARRKEAYASFLHGLWSRSRGEAPMSGDDALEAIKSMSINLYEIGKLARQEGQALPGHVEMIKMQGLWGFSSAPMNDDDLELAIDKLCEKPAERAQLRELRDASWAQVALIRAPAKFHASEVFKEFGVDLDALLASAFEERALNEVAGAPQPKSRSPRL